MRSYCHQLLMFCALGLFVQLSCIQSVHAQRTGEWVVVDSTHSGHVNTRVSSVNGTTPGDYALIAYDDTDYGPYEVRHTTDGGKHWNVVRTDPPAYGWHLTDLAHPSPNRLLVIGDTAIQVSPGKYELHPFVLHSQDAGQVWSRTELPVGVKPFRVSMCNELHGVIWGNQSKGKNGYESMFFATSDAGSTWNALHPEIDSLFVQGVYSLSPSRILIMGNYLFQNQSVLLGTDDGGMTWKRSPLPQGIWSLDFEDSLNGWGAGGNPTGTGDYTDVITRSTDGGTTWKVVYEKAIAPAEGLAEVSFADALHGVAIGNGGKILRTSDGGASWTQDWLPSRLIAEKALLREVSCTAPDDALATTEDGYVLKYSGRQKLQAPKITAPDTKLAELSLNLIVRWTSVQGAELYDLQVADTAVDYPFVNHHVFDVPFIDTVGLTATETAIHLDPYTRFTVRVRARNATDTSDWSAYRSFTSRQIPSAPFFIAPANGATDVSLPVKLEWSEIAGVTGYDLMISESPAFPDVSVINESNIQGTSYTSSLLKTGTKYFARVRGRDSTDAGYWSSSIGWDLEFTVGGASGVGELKEGISVPLRIVPNPVTNGHANLTVRIATAGMYRIALANAIGEEVSLLADGRFGQGELHVPVHLTSMSDGLYFIRLIGSSKSQYIPVVITGN